MTIDTLLTIPEVYDDIGKQIAFVDNTYKNDIKVILIDEPEKYIQRFFLKKDLLELVEDTQLMRRLNIPSYY